MKKYSRPVIYENTVNSISESVYLNASGPWRGTDCYTSTPVLVGDGWLPNKPYWTYNSQSKHLWYVDAPEHKEAHHNEGQYTILTFAVQLPPGTTGHVNNYPLVFSSDGWQANALTSWHNNGEDNIGQGNVEIELDVPGWSNADYPENVLAALEFYDLGIDPRTNKPFRIPGVS